MIVETGNNETPNGDTKMTTATLTAIRNIAETMNTAARTMTAREMALTSHKLDRTGDKATTKDGQVWFWSNARELWVR